MDHSLFIEEHLQELRNTFNSYAKLSPQNRGLLAELWVAFKYLERGYQIRAFRSKTPYFEMDLLFYHPQEKDLILVEVKTLSMSAYLSTRIHEKQKDRLQRCLYYLAEKHQKNVRIHWAFVGLRGKIKVLEGLSY